MQLTYIMENIAKNNYTLRHLLPAEWEDYKSIRLEALKTNPEMFGSNYAKEAAYSQNDWITLLENDSRAVFALFHANLLIGLSCVAVKKDDPATAILFASFIGLSHRGKGLSKLFYQTRIDWARQNKCKLITVSHRVGNTLSKAANQRFGFKYTHSEEVNWPDGVRADELIYSLEIF